MAAPHVTGAVARYLADHPGTTPQEMRRIVRAAGRLDWFPSSDPDWKGISDTRGPTRIVDVAALEADDQDLRVWLSTGRLRVAGKETTRRLRVDVQRIGGYAGDVALSVEGLPAAVGTATFDRPGSDLVGLSGLGARLTLKLKRDGPQGGRDLVVRAEATGGSPAGARDLSLFIDRRGPRVTDLAPRIRRGVRLASTGGAARVMMRWKVTDKHSKVSQAVLQRKTGQGAWRSVPSKLTHAAVTLKPGQTDRFRVRSRDSLGNARTSPSVSTKLVLRDSDSGAWRLPTSDDWRRRSAKGAQRGSLLVAARASTSLRTTLSGKAFGIVAPVGPERGKLRVRVDGGGWVEVSLRRSRSQQRRVVYTRSLKAGAHLLEIQGVSGRTAVDALLIIR
jgi:hypothetical protein